MRPAPRPAFLGRLHPHDRLALALLLPVWSIGFVLQLHVLATDSVGAWPGVIVQAPSESDGLPVVAALQPWEPESSGLEPGDQLVRVGEVPLDGVGPLGFAVLARAEAAGDLHATVDYVRGGRPGRTVLHLRPHPAGWVLPVIALSFAATGLFVLLRAPGSLEARAFFPAAFAFSFMMLHFHGGPSRAQTLAWLAVNSLTFAWAPPFIVRWAMLTPEEVASPSRLPPWSFAFSALAIAFPSWLTGWPLPHDVGLRMQFLLSAALALTTVGLFVRNYLRASRRGRRKIKWILYGVTLAGLPIATVTLVASSEPGLWFAAEPAWVAIALLPLFVWIAIARYNAFDIDRVISTTVSWALVFGGGAVVLGVGVPAIAGALGAAAGKNVLAAQAIAGALVAACLVPAHRVLRPRLEQLLFSERYELQSGMEALLARLPGCGSSGEVLTLVGERLSALFQPEVCVVFAQSGDALSPCFFSGDVSPPAFSMESPLVASVRALERPLTADSGTGRRPSPDPFERAVLESLGAEVVLPVRDERGLAAFLAIGAKRSHDVYTPTDLALLSALGQAIAGELKRFDAVENLRQSREMQERLRRYVPGAVAEQVESGHELAPEAREVSVLFVDIRGYTSLCEGRPPEAIFDAVNRHTEAVSKLVREHGGTVVEFNGDGMMAVFGAPEPLPHKERAAVNAAREIAEAAGSIHIGGGEEAVPLRVGVGIATGTAFVGNVRSSDRLIWTALGNATNLAARLQALSRELDAAVVIDSVTHEGARHAALDFVCHQALTIRGRSRPEDVWTLPLGAL